MRRDVRFIVLNGDERFAKELRGLLSNISCTKIVAEIDEPAMLSQAITHFPADIVLVNLDPSPEAILPLLGEVASKKASLAIFAASESTDGQLILAAMRTGIREFLPKPIDATGLEEAISRVAVNRMETAPTGQVITVVGTTGGVGATMFSTNLAVELAALCEGKVVLVDLDHRFGQVATFMDLDPKFTLADLCGSPEALDQQIIEKAMVRHHTGVYVLSRPTNFGEADTITAASCVGVLSSLVQWAEYIVVDGPNRSDVASKSVLALSDLNLLVLQLLVPCVRNASRILENMREGGYRTERTRLVCNREGRESSHLSIQDVKNTLAMEVLASVPDDWTSVSGAINLGEPLRTHSPKSRARQAIQEIAARLYQGDTSSDEKDTTKKGLIGRIFANV